MPAISPGASPAARPRNVTAATQSRCVYRGNFGEPHRNQTYNPRLRVVTDTQNARHRISPDVFMFWRYRQYLPITGLIRIPVAHADDRLSRLLPLPKPNRRNTEPIAASNRRSEAGGTTMSRSTAQPITIAIPPISRSTRPDGLLHRHTHNAARRLSLSRSRWHPKRELKGVDRGSLAPCAEPSRP